MPMPMPMPMPCRPIGFHVSGTGGVGRVVARVEELGADALQVFSSNPRGWALPEPDPAGDEELGGACAERGWPPFLHAPYLVNLASPDRATRARSVESLAFALGRGARLGARAVVVHAGSTLGTDRAAARRRAASAILDLLERVEGIDLAIEPTAGGGDRSLARHVAGAAALIDACGGHPRVGVCLDSCHLWAAGVDWPSTAGLQHLRTEVRSLGNGRVRVVHVNDSRDPRGSGRDRHADLGDGAIGLDPFTRLLAAPELRAVPAILETPGGVERRRADLAALRRPATGRGNPEARPGAA